MGVVFRGSTHYFRRCCMAKKNLSADCGSRSVPWIAPTPFLFSNFCVYRFGKRQVTHTLSCFYVRYVTDPYCVRSHGNHILYFFLFSFVFSYFFQAAEGVILTPNSRFGGGRCTSEQDFSFSLCCLCHPIFGHKPPMVFGLWVDGAQFLHILHQIVANVVLAHTEDA